MNLMKAELMTIRIKYELGENADYSSKEKFLELEDYFMAYAKFFRKNWEQAKKQIRKEILWAKADKDL